MDLVVNYVTMLVSKANTLGEERIETCCIDSYHEIPIELYTCKLCCVCVCVFVLNLISLNVYYIYLISSRACCIILYGSKM